MKFNFYYPSAYEQKQPAGMKPSSPVTPPCSTPVSPLHHASPTAAPTPKPDRTYTHIPPSQPLPENTYSMDHRYSHPFDGPPPLPPPGVSLAGLFLQSSLFFFSSRLSGFDASFQSPVTRFLHLQQQRQPWSETVDLCTTDRCLSPTSLSLLRASNRSTLTPCLNTQPWWAPL